jgi:radical SAM/Cys-rich protein
MPDKDAFRSGSSEGTAAKSLSQEAFASCLERHGLFLRRGRTTALQVNVGRICNMACRHCHLEAGPHRAAEVMSPAVMAQTADYARRGGFASIDVTGGAPELVPGIGDFLTELAGIAPRLLFRANLTALAAGDGSLPGLLARLKAVVVASLPSVSASQAESQRGAGSFAASIEALQALNALGYGRPGSGLALDLVSNPAGAFLPPAQAPAQNRFRTELARRHGIVFNALYVFANVPLGRFRRWLTDSGNLEGYLAKLAGAFNPGAVAGVMCRTQVSVDFDGRLYDCDFNLAAGLPCPPGVLHVADAPPPAEGTPIPTGQHCFACTAGAGFT